MFVLVLAAAAVLQVQVNAGVSRDTVTGQRTGSVGIRVGGSPGDSVIRRIPVTAQHLATAFASPEAKTLLERARVARFVMDSALRSYDAKAFQRVSVSLGVRENGRTRLASREEAAGRIQFDRDRGAFVDLLGRRSTNGFEDPSEQNAAPTSVPGQSVPIPYFPRSDDLWIGGSIARVDVDERQLVHPIARGSEAYYTYAIGDSMTIILPDDRRIVLRELKVEARVPQWNLIVGSFWFDQSSARLVRAAYRMSVDIDVWQVSAERNESNDVPLLARGLLSPLKGGVHLITIEYALYDGRFWLPVVRAAEGSGRASLLKVPFVLEERFVYESVNGPVQVAQFLDSLPGAVNVRRLRDSLTRAGVAARARDSVVAARQRIAADSARNIRKTVCTDPAAGALQRSLRYGATLPVVVRVPCDLASLAKSPELPASPFDAGDELFGTAERAVMRRAMNGLQAGWGPQRAAVDYGTSQTRYNRVEGFSTGLAVRQDLGLGLAWLASVRGSVGDRQVNGELGVLRGSGPSTLRVNAYRRLVSSNDWGTPLGFGASIANVLYARDEGLYHRAWGAEAEWMRERAARTTFRAFVEEQWTAPVTTRFTLFRGNDDDRFIENLTAQRGTFAGGVLRTQRSFGNSPTGWRVDTDLRLEAAGGAAEYARGALDLGVSHGLPGKWIGSLTGAAGSSVGDVPPQRAWYLGGLQTVRGQTAGTAAGDAFWLVRSELARAGFVRPSLFADWGWAGSRDAISAVGRPLTGVGSGLSVLDGIVRLDVARGLWPREQWRVDVSFGARF